MGLFIAVSLAGFALIFLEMQTTGFMRFLQGTGFAAWRLPLVLALVLSYSLMLVQTLEQRGTMLCILLVWLLPILVAIVGSAALEELNQVLLIVASLSPLASLLIAGLLPTAQAYAPLSAGDEIATVLTGLHSGIFFLAAQIALLGWRWRYLRRRLQ
jgi:hypothetical protein